MGDVFGKPGNAALGNARVYGRIAMRKLWVCQTLQRSGNFTVNPFSEKRFFCDAEQYSRCAPKNQSFFRPAPTKQVIQATKKRLE
jgi:hypothetical protein